LLRRGGGKHGNSPGPLGKEDDQTKGRPGDKVEDRTPDRFKMRKKIFDIIVSMERFTTASSPWRYAGHISASLGRQIDPIPILCSAFAILIMLKFNRLYA
jgi:hypothetical protein